MDIIHAAVTEWFVGGFFIIGVLMVLVGIIQIYIYSR